MYTRGSSLNFDRKLDCMEKENSWQSVFFISFFASGILSRREERKREKIFLECEAPSNRARNAIFSLHGFHIQKKKVKLRGGKVAKVPHISPSPWLQFLQFAKFRAEKDLFATFFQKGILKKRRRERRGCPPFFRISDL